LSGKITLVTGGARSGKSNFAEELAKSSNMPVAYLATAIPFDDGMRDRIKKHREGRPQAWTTYEGFKDLHHVIKDVSASHGTVLLDCVTIMVTNLMFEDSSIDWDRIDHEQIDSIEERIKNQVFSLLESIRQYNLWSIIVTNEVGMGIVSENRLSRIFGDIAGRINQIIAAEADEVYFTVSGIPMKIK
jgi:adenosylcobinamide kinase/adenosylcobinamide-phosphate guanylyltransferase